MQKEEEKKSRTKNHPLLGLRVGAFEGIPIYESRRLGEGYNSGGLALPGLGIVVGLGAFSKELDLETVRHEFGHILQARLTGKVMFYLFVGLPSLLSAWLNWHGRGHNQYWTEVWCNHLAKKYFSEALWPDGRFPIKDLTSFSKYWLTQISDKA